MDTPRLGAASYWRASRRSKCRSLSAVWSMWAMTMFRGDSAELGCGAVGEGPEFPIPARDLHREQTFR